MRLWTSRHASLPLLPNTPPRHCRPFLAYVEEKVGDTCGYGETRDRQREVMVVLRALGNAGLLPFEAFPEKCYLVGSWWAPRRGPR